MTRRFGCISQITNASHGINDNVAKADIQKWQSWQSITFVTPKTYQPFHSQLVTRDQRRGWFWCSGMVQKFSVLSRPRFVFQRKREVVKRGREEAGMNSESKVARLIGGHDIQYPGDHRTTKHGFVHAQRDNERKQGRRAVRRKREGGLHRSPFGGRHGGRLPSPFPPLKSPKGGWHLGRLLAPPCCSQRTDHRQPSERPLRGRNYDPQTDTFGSFRRLCPFRSTDDEGEGRREEETNGPTNPVHVHASPLLPPSF